MKKLLSLFSIIAISASLAANAAESQLQNYVNKKLEPAVKKNKNIRLNRLPNKKANEQKRAEFQKKQEADKAALEKAKKMLKQDVKQEKKLFKLKKDYINSFRNNH